MTPARPSPEARPVRRPRARLLATGLALAVLLPLAGCEADNQELQAWMDQQRREVRPNVEPLEPPKKFNPVPYQNAQVVDPFSSQKLSVAMKSEARQPSSMLAAELNRRKQPLESFPLDSMSMVGSVAGKGGPRALLKVDSLLYTVKPGDYVGQNYGRILNITETSVSIREIVQDAAGEWIERPTTLQLQEQGR